MNEIIDKQETPNEILPEKPADKSVGPVISIIIIIAVLVVGALYFWGSQLNKQSPSATTTPLISE